MRLQEANPKKMNIHNLPSPNPAFEQKRAAMITLLLGAAALATPAAYALPAYARADGISCIVCHVRADRLNSVGLDYYQKGFRSEVKAAGSTMPVRTNLGAFLSGQGQLNWRKDQGKDYTTSNQITLYGTGALGGNFSFLAETTVNPPDAQEVADLYLGYTSGTKNNYQFLRLGQMLPLIAVDNPYEVAADRDPVFVRDRRQGISYGYNYGRFWVEGLALSSAGPKTGNKADWVLNGQYLFDDEGTSLGFLYWDGSYNSDSGLSDKFRRLELLGNYNGIKNTYLTAGYSTATGDSGAGGEDKSKGWFGQAEYAITDQWTFLVHAIDVNPDKGDGKAVWTFSLNYWPHQNVALRLQLVETKPDSGPSRSSVRARVRIMF